ncbi:hypothetical protein GRF59_11040 [Paenibacillus sp. HJL G12]|uniref:Spore coat protein n=1 Tax=Paenibacillus dendrobii TaxID=2691084 RepID=A0A7X3LI33_9BACL|nr:hypothetical protein [Paenibacillus dendrobii]MWV44168.1 hypothetical protein [Paenibacillus dendrobii]
MQSGQMQAITGKELEYIVDSISNEDLLIKQCAATAATSQNATIQQACQQYIRSMDHHLEMLIQALQQHQSLAPNQPQQ